MSYVRFFAGDQFVFNLLVLVAVVNHYPGAEGGFVLGKIVQVDHRKLGHALLELRQPRIYVALPLFGHVVLGIFAQVAVCARGSYLFGQLVVQLALQLLDLLF